MDDKRIEDGLFRPIMLAEQVRSAAEEAESFKAECGEVGKRVDRLSHMMRALMRLTTGNQTSLYERPIRRVVSEVSNNLDRALSLVRKCKRKGVLRRFVIIASAADFRKLISLLDSSVGDMKWLLSVFDSQNGGGGGGGIVLSLPPIASNDPILSWVWSFIASIQMGQLTDRIEAANELASLAQDNDRNKKIIVEEGGVPPLLKLLKETSSPDAQIAAATALYNLANDQERARIIVGEAGVPIIVQVLGDSPMKVQIMVANLVAIMAGNDLVSQEDFARQNVIRPLVTLLSFETFVDNPNPIAELSKHSIHSIVQINKEMERKNYRPYTTLFSNSHSEGSSRGGQHRRERESEKSEVKLQLKISCAKALWMLAGESILNCRGITETKGLLCLAKLVEKEEGELQLNCLMTIMEITAAAESNADLRRAAFKTNSPAAKAVVDQLLRVIEDLDNPSLQIPAVKSIGSLARTFPARETRVVGPLVSQLSSTHQEVATEAAIALKKFACPDNFLCIEHSKAIIDFNGVPPLMKLLRGTELHALILLCYLALHVSNEPALEQARVLTALEGADHILAQQPELKELVAKAVYQLNLYHSGSHSQRLP